MWLLLLVVVAVIVIAVVVVGLQLASIQLIFTPLCSTFDRSCSMVEGYDSTHSLSEREVESSGLPSIDTLQI